MEALSVGSDPINVATGMVARSTSTGASVTALARPPTQQQDSGGTRSSSTGRPVAHKRSRITTTTFVTTATEIFISVQWEDEAWSSPSTYTEISPQQPASTVEWPS